MKKHSEVSFFDKEYFTGKGKSNYWWTIGDYENLAKSKHWGEILKSLKKIKSSGKLLDIGCAYGFFIKIASAQFRSYGIDISSFAIRKSRKITDKTLRASANSLPFKDKSFDVITALDTLEHVSELNTCMRELRRILKKNGILLLLLPNPIWWNFFSIFKLEDKSHVNKFNIEKWEQILLENDLEIKKRFGILSGTFKKFSFFRKFQGHLNFFPEWLIISSR